MTPTGASLALSAQSGRCFTSNGQSSCTGKSMCGTTASLPSQSPPAPPTTTNDGNGDKPKPSFYKRPLPDACIAFTSPAGKAVFASALQTNGLKSFFSLMEQFTTQSEPAYCGISTLVVVLNALAVDPRQTWKGPWRWYHEGMLNCCIDLKDVQQSGITLQDFVGLARCQGLLVSETYCHEAESIDKFRDAVKQACQDINNEEDATDSTCAPATDSLLKVLVVSYSRKVFGQTGSGHFSPIAAYDAASDKVLILDTARFKYGAHWVDLKLMYEAMQSKDPTTDKPRGYILLSFENSIVNAAADGENDDIQHDDANMINMGGRCNCPQPISLLFRPKMVDGGIQLRHDYKLYLNSKKLALSVDDETTTIPQTITWNDVYDYWTTTKNENNNNDTSITPKIWKVLEALVLPTDCDDGVQRILNMKVMLRKLLSSDAKTMNDDDEGMAIYVMYLASLSEAERERVLDEALGDDHDDDNDTKLLLLKEVELVSLAMDVGDDMTIGT